MGIVGTIFKAIKTAFTFKKKPKDFELRVVEKIPPMHSIQEQYAFIEAKHQQENATLRAEVAKLQAELEKYKQDKNRRKEEEKIKQELYKQQLESQRLKALRRVKLKILLNPPPNFYLRNNKVFGKMMGFIMQESDEGETYYYPWVYVNKSHKIINKPVRSIAEMFRDQVGIVSQINGGKVDSNYDILTDGSAVVRPPNIKVDADTGEKVKLVHLAETEARKYELTIEEYKNQLNKLSSILEDFQAENEKLKLRLGEQEMILKAAKDERDIAQATVGVLTQQQAAAAKLVADSAASLQSIKVEQVLTSQLADDLQDAWLKIRQKHRTLLAEEDKEVEAAKVKEIVQYVLANVREKLTAPQPPPPPPKKE